MDIQISDVKTWLAIPKDIVLTSHRNPDGDAIGSSLAMYHYLVQLGHTVRIIFPSEYPQVFNFMPAHNEIIIFDLEPERGRELLERSDLLFILDYNALDRVDKLGEAINGLKHPIKILMIDHHLFPEPFADYILSDTTASSTSELVYDFIRELGDGDKINKAVADCIYTGVVTDTGSFKYNTSPKLFRTVAALLETGVDDAKIQDYIFNSQIEKNLRLLGHCLDARMEIFPEFKTGLITLNKQDYEKYDIQRGDTEGVVNYLLSLKDVRLACFITEQPTIVKISMRSKGDFNVQEICRDHFKGGGHKNASGGYSFSGLKATVAKFKELLPKYKDKLLQTEEL